jgi:hypothetical protein
MIYLHKHSNRQMILIETQGDWGLFTEHGEEGCAKVRMDHVETAFDANTRAYLSRSGPT